MGTYIFGDFGGTIAILSEEGRCSPIMELPQLTLQMFKHTVSALYLAEIYLPSVYEISWHLWPGMGIEGV